MPRVGGGEQPAQQRSADARALGAGSTPIVWISASASGGQPTTAMPA